MSTTSAHITADQFTASELAHAEAAQAGLPASSALRSLLQTVIDAGRRGAGITVIAQDAVLTPNQAAQALGMSRPYLLNFIRAGVLKVHYVGTHQRISHEDFVDFRERHERASQQMVAAITSPLQRRRKITLSDAQMAEIDNL